MKKSEFKELLKECLVEVLPPLLKEMNLQQRPTNTNSGEPPPKDATVIVDAPKDQLNKNAKALTQSMSKIDKAKANVYAQIMAEAAERTGEKIKDFERSGALPGNDVELSQFEKLGAKPQNWMRLALQNK